MKIINSLIAHITQHESSFITLSTLERDESIPMRVVLTPPAALADSAGIHSISSTLRTRAANTLGILRIKRF